MVKKDNVSYSICNSNVCKWPFELFLEPHYTKKMNKLNVKNYTIDFTINFKHNS